MSQTVQTSGDAPIEAEATLPRIAERSADGVMQAVAVPFGQYATKFCEVLESRFADADRVVAIQVEKGVYDPGTALTVLHHVAATLSGGDEALREQLLPSRTETAARGKAGADLAPGRSSDVAELIAAAANVLQVIEGHHDLKRPLNLETLRAGSNYQTLLALVSKIATSRNRPIAACLLALLLSLSVSYPSYRSLGVVKCAPVFRLVL